MSKIIVRFTIIDLNKLDIINSKTLLCWKTYFLNRWRFLYSCVQCAGFPSGNCSRNHGNWRGPESFEWLPNQWSFWQEDRRSKCFLILEWHFKGGVLTSWCKLVGKANWLVIEHLQSVKVAKVAFWVLFMLFKFLLWTETVLSKCLFSCLPVFRF